ncbi:MAG TPA: hypothetical protein VGJ94_06320 [Syntrophorhabdaceae bacterium]
MIPEADSAGDLTGGSGATGSASFVDIFTSPTCPFTLVNFLTARLNCPCRDH